MWSSIFLICTPSVLNAIRRKLPPQMGHTSGNTWQNWISVHRRHTLPRQSTVPMWSARSFLDAVGRGRAPLTQTDPSGHCLQARVQSFFWSLTMQVISLTLKGFKSARDGLGRDELTLDFQRLADGAGLVALAGANGRGKTVLRTAQSSHGTNLVVATT